jgi:hypothetical protein
MRIRLRTFARCILSNTETHEIRKTVQFLTEQASTSHHSCNSAIESVEPESKNRQEMSPVKTSHGFGARSLLQVGAQTEVVDAQEDA